MLDGLQVIGQQFRKNGFDPAKHNFISDYGEQIIKSCWGGFRPASKNRPPGVDLTLPNGKTLQVKSCNEKRPTVTCTYEGDERVDLLVILEFDRLYSDVRVLYFGPFADFITEVNKHTKVMKKDNHRTPSKKLIRRLDSLFGLPFPNMSDSLVGEFFKIV